MPAIKMAASARGTYDAGRALCFGALLCIWELMLSIGDVEKGCR